MLFKVQIPRKQKQYYAIKTFLFFTSRHCFSILFSNTIYNWKKCLIFLVIQRFFVYITIVFFFRLHLFGLDSTIRPGWLTLGHELTSSNFNIKLYKEYFNNGQLTTGCTDRIEKLRPKSPTNNVCNNK